VRRDPPPLRSILGQDQQPGHERRSPAEPGCHDRRRQSDLLVVLAKGRLDRGDLGLDLHDDKAVRPRMPAQEIDRAALAPLRVRHLCDGLPVEVAQPARRRIDEGGVPSIEQPVNIRPQSADIGLEGQAEDGHDPPRRRDPDPGGATLLEVRDEGPADASPRRQVDLAPATPMAKDPNESA
jgi:hypothetical protein